jgi:2,4-dienoyl-CoA reductase-like NADH-dependent reductase (Old Yellow Enzyme family)
MGMGADFISLGRGALANHDWPNRIAADSLKQPLWL